jgi:hypothetical protein
MAKKKVLQLEMNEKFKKSNDTFVVGTTTVMITPAVGEEYWMFRVKLSKDQSIIGFPKFSTIGIGFAKEEDWNTNLPYSCEAEKIYKHIRHNKGNKRITVDECITAIQMIQEAAKKYKGA